MWRKNKLKALEDADLDSLNRATLLSNRALRLGAVANVLRRFEIGENTRRQIFYHYAAFRIMNESEI